MIKKFLACAGVAASCFLVAAPASATAINLVSNGTFTTAGTGGQPFADWTVSGNATNNWKSVTIPGSNPATTTAGISCNANNCLTSTGRDDLSQTVDVIAGKTYELTFDFAPGSAFKGSQTNGLTVELNGFSLDALKDIGSTTPELYTVIFTASNLEADGPLAFLGREDNASTYSILDNVSLVAVPEPATWVMMLMGFGMVGFGIRSRRRNARVTYG